MTVQDDTAVRGCPALASAGLPIVAPVQRLSTMGTGKSPREPGIWVAE